VTSSGKDACFGTRDDLTFWAKGFRNDTWDRTYDRRILFMRKQGREAYLLFHRWWGEHFRFKDSRLAEKLTGNKLFDVWRVGDMRKKRLKELYRRTARRLKRDKLYMLRYKQDRE
jgi:hypothetical protein